MENASKALIMAGGILIGVLILALMVTLFITARNVSSNYEETKKTETIQQFNVNFTKYLGQDLTIHDVITVYNFAIQNNVAIATDGTVNEDNIKNRTQLQIDIEDERAEYNNNLEEYQNRNVEIKAIYKLSIVEYKKGYISSIKFSDRKVKVIE